LQAAAQQVLVRLAEIMQAVVVLAASIWVLLQHPLGHRFLLSSVAVVQV
jgi:hypothetical protein